MDKSTLSNYGWIVIAVLVLAVMIALATPFGTYVKTGVENTTQGLFDTSEKAMNVVGMSAKGDGGSGSVVMLEGDGQVINKSLMASPLRFRSSADINTFQSVKINGETVDPSNYVVTEGSTIITFDNNYVQSLNLAEHTIEVVSDVGTATAGFMVEENGVVPEGGTYYTGLELDEDTLSYVQGANYREYTEGESLPTINTMDVYSYGDYVYIYGKALEYAGNPIRLKINGVCDVSGVEGPTINGWQVVVKNPNKSVYENVLESINGKPIVSIASTFRDTQITDASNIVFSHNLEHVDYAFTGSPVTNAPQMVIANDDTGYYSYMFTNCIALTDVSNIQVVNGSMNSMFEGCTALLDASGIKIYGNVSMMQTFSNCSSLTTAPTIIGNILNLGGTFDGCTSLTGSITINGNFADAREFGACFRNTTQPITLIGNCEQLAEIATTANNGNVTVQQ